MSMSITAMPLDQRIAEELFGEEYNAHWHRFSTEPEHAEQLASWLLERGIQPELSGNAVTLRRGRQRLFATTGLTAMVALARAAVRLMEERPDLLDTNVTPAPH